jgi:cytochrome c oxidase subunit 2
MDKRERNWLFVLIAVFIIVNVLTFSSLVPWQAWMLWDKHTPDRTVTIHYEDYQIQMDTPLEIVAGEYIDFHASSADVTYGFGVFRQDNSMVFQMQVVPGEDNHIIWKFDEAGWYDVRSTEYSGPGHSDMFLKNAILVR